MSDSRIRLGMKRIEIGDVGGQREVVVSLENREEKFTPRQTHFLLT